MNEIPSRHKEAQVNEVLSHAEIQSLLLRNNHQPDLGKPEYKQWSNDKPNLSQVDLNERNRAANLGPALTMDQWEKKLNSKRWRINRTGTDTNKCRLVMRAVRVRQGDSWGWTEVELNARVR